MEKRKNKSKSKFFWIYSIALFSMALILILFSAFTGIRYKDEQTEAQLIYQGAQSSVVSLTDENEKLARENDENKETISNLTKDKEELEQNFQKIQDEKDKLMLQTEALFRVETLKNEKRYNEARELFDTIDPAVLGENGQARYEQLRRLLY